MDCNSKRVVVKQNGLKFGTVLVREVFDLLVLEVVLGTFDALVSKLPQLEKDCA